MSQLDLISDHSKEKLTEVPDQLLDMSNLKMLFLEGNYLTILPDNLFLKLPRLMWLDLRNNLLESIPKSIAHHKHLENLLLSNNNIKELPNELGVVPNLKALQVSENPIVYPVRRIITEGTRAIKNYLKREYERLTALTKDEEPKDEDICIEDEQEINTVDIDVAEVSRGDEDNEQAPPEPEPEPEPEQKPTCSKSLPKEKEKKEDTEEQKIVDRVEKKFSDPYLFKPTIKVRRIMPPPPPRLPPPPPPPPPPLIKRRQEEPVKFVHNVSRDGSKISLKSCFNRNNRMGIKMDRTASKNLKEGWLNQLRILLNDQERILQQERNLRALTDWRAAKKRGDTPKKFYDKSSSPLAIVPFATYPEYSKMPTREELATQLNNFLNEKGVSKAGLPKGHNLNIEKLISDLVEQIKEMENAYASSKSPRAEMEQADNQIQRITDIHKKLLNLKKSNDLSV